MPDYYKQIYTNNSDQYQEILDEREVEEISQYSIRFFNQSLKKAPIRVISHTWRQGDKLYKLAAENYGDFRFWWVIAIINKISSEADLKYGDVIKIPLEPSIIINRI